MKNEKNLLPEVGFIRINEVLKIFPIGKSTFWQGVKDGKFPKPVKIGLRISAWKVEDIRNLIQKYQSQNHVE